MMRRNLKRRDPESPGRVFRINDSPVLVAILRDEGAPQKITLFLIKNFS